MRKYILLCLFFVNVLLLFLFYRLSNAYAEEKQLILEKSNKYSLESALLQNDVISTSDGTYFLKPDMIMYSRSGDSVRLSEIKEKEFMLVLRYSNQCCSSCVDDIISKMGEFQKSNADIDVLLLTTNQIMEDDRTFRHITKIFPKVYNVFALNISIEQDIVPYLFLINNECQILDIFIPHKELPQLTERYLNMIRTRIHKGDIVATVS